LLAGFGLAFVEREEAALGHVDLAAHFADRWNVFALQRVWDIFKGANVGRDVFAFSAIATRSRRDELPFLITQRHRKPVDLGFSAKRKLFVLAQFQEATDASDEIDYILLSERVVEREHRHGVPDFLELSGRRRPHAT